MRAKLLAIGARIDKAVSLHNLTQPIAALHASCFVERVGNFYPIRHNVCQSTYIVSRYTIHLFPYVVCMVVIISLSSSSVKTCRFPCQAEVPFIAPTMPHQSCFRNTVNFNGHFHAPAPFYRSDCIAQLTV